MRIIFNNEYNLLQLTEKRYDGYMSKSPKWQNIIKVRTVEQINLLNT